MNDDIKHLFERLFVRDTDGEVIVVLDGKYESMESDTELTVQRLISKYQITLRKMAIKPPAG